MVVDAEASIVLAVVALPVEVGQRSLLLLAQLRLRGGWWHNGQVENKVVTAACHPEAVVVAMVAPLSKE